MKKLLFLVIILSVSFTSCGEAVKAPDLSDFEERLPYEKEMRKLHIEIANIQGEMTNHEANIAKIKYKSYFDIYLLGLNTINKKNLVWEEYGYKVKEVDTIFTSNNIPVFVDKNDDAQASDVVVKSINDVLFSIDSLDNVIGYKK